MTCLSFCECGERTTNYQKCKVCGDPKFLALEAELRIGNHLLAIATDNQRDLEAELETHRWIPVGERLPEEGGLYYTFAEHTSMPLETMFHKNGVGWARPMKVTHWKPIIRPE